MKKTAPEWVTLVLGRSNSGKSYWLGEEMARTSGNVLVFDPNNDHGSANKHGIRQSWDFEGEIRDFLEVQADEPERICRVRVWGVLRDFDRLALFLRNVGHLTWFVDEAHMVLPPGHQRTHPFRDLLLSSRHADCRLFLVSWQPYSLPTYCRSSPGKVMFFHTTAAQDIQWAAREASAEIAARLPNLERGAFETWRH